MSAVNEARLREVETFLHEQIPLTRAMAVRVASWDEQTLILEAPLEPNHNHLGTAFGGSLSALTTLAGYSLLWLLLGEAKAHVVVRESTIRYRHPVRGTLRAVCGRPAEEEVEKFRAIFAQSGKARLSLVCTVEDEGRVCVEFEGSFVALR